MSRVCRTVLCQEHPRLNIEKAMRENKIIVCNFSKGEVGIDTARFLSALMVCKVEMALFKRNKSSTPFFLFLDEFQNYVTGSFETILSESRKYNIGMSLYHQYFHQLTPSMQHAIRGNVGTTIVFRVPDDAKMVADALGWEEDDLKMLDNYNYVARRLVNGRPEREAHAIKSKKPPEVAGHGEYIIERSRRLYGNDAGEIETNFYSKMKGEESNGDATDYGWLDDAAGQSNLRIFKGHRSVCLDRPGQRIVFPSQSRRGYKQSTVDHGTQEAQDHRG
jgi:hypothetical protein